MLSVPVVCSSCVKTDLPWWQVAILTLVGCLIAVGLLSLVAKLLPDRRTPAAPPVGQGPASAGGPSEPAAGAHTPAGPYAAGPPGPPPARAPAPAPAPAFDPFRTVAVNREERYSLEIDDRTGRCWVTFPVSSGAVDYTEEYEVDRATFDYFAGDLTRARDFVARCRNREMDHLLRLPPGTNRGVPC